MNKEVLILFFLNMLSGVGYSIIAPLFPILGEEDSISEELLGWMISFYALSDFFSTPFVPKIIKKIGREKVLYFATAGEATCTFIYGLLNHIKNRKFLILLIFFLRIIHGISSGIVSVLVYSLTGSLSDEDDIQTSLGYQEVAWSLGAALGPLGASLFYSIGGYSCPFMVAGLVLYFSVYLTSKLDFEFNKENDENVEGDPSFLSSLCHTKIILSLGTIICSVLAEAFYYPSLTNHLINNYHLTVSISSCFFVIGIIAYFIYLQFLDNISNKIGIYCHIFIGLLMACIGCYCIFPVNPFPKNIISVIFGLSLTGAAGGPIGILCLMLLSDFIKKVNPNIDEFSANDISSAMYNFFFNIGDFLSPILGGFISTRLGFYYSCLYISMVIFIYSIIFIIYFYNDIIDGIKNPKKYEELEEGNIKDEFLKKQQNVDEEFGQVSGFKRSASSSSLLRVTKRFSLRLDMLGRKRHTSNLTIYNRLSRRSSNNSLTKNPISN